MMNIEKKRGKGARVGLARLTFSGVCAAHYVTVRFDAMS
jgi:hypothetical protein